VIENNWSLVVIALCSLLLVVLLLVEIKRTNRAWLALRLIANVVAVVSLALIIVPVYVKQSKVDNKAIPVALLTHAYDSDSVALFKKLNPNSLVYFYGPDEEKNQEKEAITIGHLTLLKVATTHQIHLFGEGLDEEEIDLLSGSPIVFHPSLRYKGIQAISWNKRVVLGEQLIIQGTYLNATSSPEKLVLTGFNTAHDSTTIPANTTRTFQLATLPKNVGKAIFFLTALKNKDTLVCEPLPIEVITPQPVSVLVLASSPDFENKFLKNWLSGHGYKVALRTSISINKYSKEFVNLPSLPIASLQSTVINQFDVVIADAKELMQMSRGELGALHNSIDQKGVGLVIRADSSLQPGAFYNRNFSLSYLELPENKFVVVHGRDTSFHFKPLKADGILYLRSTAGNLPVFYDQQNRPLVSEAIYGAGKILIQPVANTYQWVLSGNNIDYENFWSTMLNTAAKKQTDKEQWYADHALPIVDKPVSIQLLHSNDSMPVGQIGTEKVYLQQNAMLPYKWNGIYWPRSAGWHSFIGSDGIVENWYVFDKNEYRNLQSIQKANFTRQHVKPVFNKTSVEGSTLKKVPISIAWFFFSFLLGAGFLWIEKKFL